MDIVRLPTASALVSKPSPVQHRRAPTSQVGDYSSVQYLRRRSPRSSRRFVSWSRRIGITGASQNFRRVASCSGSPRRLHRHQPVAVHRTGCRLLQSPGYCGTMDQGRQERHHMDAAVMSEVPHQRGAAPASCPGLQSRQLHADFGLAQRGGALVADHTEREAGEDRSQGRPPWPLRHFPTGRGGVAKEAVRENLGLDR